MRISDWSSDVCSSDLFGSDLIVRKQPRDVVHRMARQVLRDFGDHAIGRAVWIMLAQPAQRARRRDDDDVVAVDPAVIAQKAGDFGNEAVLRLLDRKSTRLNSSH